MSVIIDGTNGISDVDGSASTPAIRGTDANTGIFFPAADTIAFAEGGTEVMRIDSSGNVGIGTSSPNAPLNIQKADVSGFSTNTEYDCLVVENGTSAKGAVVQIVAATNGVSEVGFSDSTRNMGLVGYNHSTDAMYFQTNSSERMRITSGGDVLVNATSTFGSGNKFSVVSSNNILGVKITGSEGVMIDFRDNANDQCGFIYSVASSNTTSYNTSSDYRLKENVAPMAGALAKVQQLKPVTFTWKNTNIKGQGFIAHELQAVVPDCVTGEKDAVETYIDDEGNEQTRIKPQGIDTSFLVATITAAIQELNAKVEAQAAEIAALKNSQQPTI